MTDKEKIESLLQALGNYGVPATYITQVRELGLTADSTPENLQNGIRDKVALLNYLELFLLHESIRFITAQPGGMADQLAQGLHLTMLDAVEAELQKRGKNPKHVRGREWQCVKEGPFVKLLTVHVQGTRTTGDEEIASQLETIAADIRKGSRSGLYQHGEVGRRFELDDYSTGASIFIDAEAKSSNALGSIST